MTFRASAPAYCAALSGLIACHFAWGERLFLVVATSTASPSEIAERAKALAPLTPNGIVIKTGDCGDKRDIFAFVTELAASREAAQPALARAKASIHDAYIKSCEVRPGSLLALRIPAVDASIANVPKDAVNWSAEDRVSTTQPMPDGSTLAIERYYAKSADDPLEGRRERIVLAESRGKKIVLSEQCASPGRAVASAGRVALACASEESGDHILHTVEVFEPTGKKLKEIARCRNPKWIGKEAITCEAETVGPGGTLALKATRVAVE